MFKLILVIFILFVLLALYLWRGETYCGGMCDSPLSVLKELIRSNNIIVFSKTTCPWCQKAKQLLNSKGLKYKSIELDVNDNDKYVNALVTLTGQHTVPNIFINNRHIGGFTDLQSYLSE